MNIISKYETLVDEERWEEALIVIKEIVKRGPSIPTSWFNWGVCLSALDRESEAAEKFLKAYELDPEDFGAQYRAFRSLYFAGDYEGFFRLAERELEKMPEIIEGLTEDEDFSVLFERPEFRKLREKYE